MNSDTRRRRRRNTRKGDPGRPPGRPGIGPLHKGDLSIFGYVAVTSLSEGKRHLALARAVREYGPLSVFRKLNAVYIYSRHTAPVSSAIFKLDRDWVKEYFGV